MAKWKIINIPEFPDKERGGNFVVAEIFKATEDLFDCACRVYFIVNEEDRIIERGGHYHFDNQELWLVPVGRVTVELHSQKGCETNLVLDKKTQALLIPAGTWHSLKLDPGTVLVSLASKNYDPSESIFEIQPCACKN